MKSLFIATMLLLAVGLSVCAQQQVTIISQCGGWDTIAIPNIVDNDLDGMDDALEQLLLDRFMPYIVQYNSDDCPGPNTDGTGDTNLVVCRIYPIPQQYTSTASIDSVKLSPIPIVGPRGLTVGLTWYPTVIKINAALLFGKDCGLISHTADVEGFNFSLKYIGPLAGGWMYDTNMQNWTGGTLQTISHAGTFCEAVETFPYRSPANPTGKDTIYPSPDKHGQYLTTGRCSSNPICDPSCSGAFTRKRIKNINLGEPTAPLVSNLGSTYTPYAGQDPWGNADFLNGGAGTIKSKMTLPINTTFVQGSLLSSQAMICNLYRNCYGTAGSAILAYTCAGAPYNFYNQQLTTPGVYTQTLQTPYGCDSTVTLTLAINQPDTVAITAAICAGNSYSFDGQILSATGTYQASYTNAGGCDSTVTLNLMVDTVLNMALNATICAGQSYTHQGQALIAAGTYTDTFTAMGGCDSIVTLQLQVNAVPPIPTITANNAQLYTDTNGITTHQWYVNGNAIPGANAATYTAPINGYYQVMVGNSAGCSSLSDSLWITTVGILEQAMGYAKIYPNPAQGQISIEMPIATSAPISITVYNVAGKQVYAATATGTVTSINIEQWAPGLYWVRLYSPNGYYWNGKIIKN